jgi:hypothetical protein
MSSPIPALNPARSHDPGATAATVVPLERRAQPFAEVLADASGARTPTWDEPVDRLPGTLDESPVQLDGNLYASASLVQAPPRHKDPAGWRSLNVTLAGHVAAGAVDVTEGRRGSVAPPLSLPSSAVMATLAARASGRHLPDTRTGDTTTLPTRAVSVAGGRGDASPLLPSLASTLPTTKSLSAAHADSRDPAAGSAVATSLQVRDRPIDGSAVASPGDASAMPESRADEGGAAPHGERRRAGAESTMPPLHAAAHSRSPATAYPPTADVRRQDGSATRSKPTPAFAAPPDLVPVQRVTSVSVPFSSWGPGHHVTATWVPFAVADPLPSITLRSSSDAARRAIGSALDASDPAVLGGLELAAADSADDGTSGHRRAHHVPEDDE